MSSGQDVSEFLDILGLVKSYFSSFFEKNTKNRDFFFCGAPDAPEDQAICLFAGFLANPDMALSHQFESNSPFLVFSTPVTGTPKVEYRGSQGGFSHLIHRGSWSTRSMPLDFDLLDRMCLVYIVMSLIVASLFGCVFTVFSPGDSDTVHTEASCVDRLPK
jgi:hypothetical protein